MRRRVPLWLATIIAVLSCNHARHECVIDATVDGAPKVFSVSASADFGYVTEVNDTVLYVHGGTGNGYEDLEIMIQHPSEGLSISLPTAGSSVYYNDTSLTGVHGMSPGTLTLTTFGKDCDSDIVGLERHCENVARGTFSGGGSVTITDGSFDCPFP